MALTWPPASTVSPLSSLIVSWDCSTALTKKEQEGTVSYGEVFRLQVRAGCCHYSLGGSYKHSYKNIMHVEDKGKCTGSIPLS